MAKEKITPFSNPDPIKTESLNFESRFMQFGEAKTRVMSLKDTSGRGTAGKAGFIEQSKALFERMDGIGEEPNEEQKTALNKFIKRLVDSGIWAKLDLYYKFDGHEEASTLLNIIADEFNCDLSTITPPAFTQYFGIKGNGEGYADTNFNPATDATFFVKTSLSFGAYFYDIEGFNSASMGGNGGSLLGIFAKDAANSIRARISDGTTSINSGAYFLNQALIMVGTEGADVVIYLNGREWYREADLYGTFDSLNQFLYGFNSSGTSANETTNGKADVIYAGELTAAQHLELYDSIIEYQAGKSGDYFYDSSFMSGIPSGNPLDKICTVGDSLTANFVGGDIPAQHDEGDGYRPMRLTVNNIARRIYDQISTNKATHIRLDKSEWTKSGTWTEINDETIFEPTYSNEKYHESIASGAYVEISVPDGMDEFAFICQRDAGYDTLTVTINGGSIAAYGNSTVDCNRTKDSAGDLGNPYHTEEYTGLPAGINVIRIAKGANTAKARIWGGFYWTGETIIVHNTAHGGHRMASLNQDNLNAEVVENNFNAVLFQITLVNELTSAVSYNTSVSNFMDTITLLTGIDVLYTTCQPLGTSPVSGINSYQNYQDPWEIDLSNYMKFHAWRNNVPMNDLLNQFKAEIEANGGNVPDGDGGVYTTDGVHPNEAGVTKWFSYISKYF